MEDKVITLELVPQLIAVKTSGRVRPDFVLVAEILGPPLVILPRLSYHNHLLTLPNDLYREILQYLIFDDIGNLDRALVKRQLRDCYLSAISGMITPLPMKMFLNQDLCEIFLLWLSQRNIRFKYAEHFSYDKDDVLKLIIQSKPHLERLECHLDFEDADLQAIGLCPRLQFLSLPTNRLITFGGLRDFLRMHPLLEKLSIKDDAQFSDQLLEYLFVLVPISLTYTFLIVIG
jgi:hypothetical protein